MNEANDVFIVDGVRSPRGRGNSKGALHNLKPVELGRQAVVALMRRTPMPPERVEDLLLGCVTQRGEQGANIAKTVASLAGLPATTSAATLNRFCASGLSAANLMAAAIGAGQCEVGVAGGLEMTSRVPMFSDQGPWFADPEVARATRFVHMGVSADLVASLAGVSRVEADAYAAETHQRAAEAMTKRRHHHVSAVDSSGDVLLDQDELIRADTTERALAKLPALFGSEHGVALAREQTEARNLALRAVHHAGNSPKVADGASVLMLASRTACERYAIRPVARICGAIHASSDPVRMLDGNGAAIARLTKQLGWKYQDIDRFEVNESFAGVMVALQRELGVGRRKFNPDGGAIARGHALGATGSMLVCQALDGLVARGGGRAVISICGGAGVIATTAIETLP